MTFNCLFKFRSFGSEFPPFSINHSVLDILCPLIWASALSLLVFFLSNCLFLPKFRQKNSSFLFRRNYNLSLTPNNIFFHLHHFELELPSPSPLSPGLNSQALEIFTMLHQLEFPIFLHWTCKKDQATYQIIRHKYDEHGNVKMIFHDGEALDLTIGSPKGHEFFNHIHSRDFIAPKSHGFRGIIKFHKLKTKLMTTYHELQWCPDLIDVLNF